MRTHRNHAATHKRRQQRQTRLNRHRGVRLRTRDALPRRTAQRHAHIGRLNPVISGSMHRQTLSQIRAHRRVLRLLLHIQHHLGARRMSRHHRRLQAKNRQNTVEYRDEQSNTQAQELHNGATLFRVVLLRKRPIRAALQAFLHTLPKRKATNHRNDAPHKSHAPSPQ